MPSSRASRRVTRRQFLQAGAATAGAFAVPYFVPATSFGANEKVVTGHIGVGNQGTGNLKAFLKHAAAVCEVDSKRLGAAVKVVEAAGKKCDAYSDYRKLLERKDLDAVVITTPDHWHALQTIHACQAGKDVYVEKPLSLTVVEGRKMVEAARKYGRIVQTGSQQRSGSEFRTACEYVRSGRIGKVEKVLVGIPSVNFRPPPVPDSAPPAELDYEMWLGPAPQRPYNEKRVHYLFRFFWDYSGGQMTNFGAHHLDIAQWGLGMDNAGPVEIEGTARFHDMGWYEVPSSCRVTMKYSTGTTVIVGQEQKDIPGGATFIGDKGTIYVNRGKITSTPDTILKEPLRENDVKLYVSKNHHQNFLECIATRKLPICDVEIGHRSATVCHLANIAVRTGKKFQWDPVKETAPNDEEVTRMLQRPYRAPWTLG